MESLYDLEITIIVFLQSLGTWLVAPLQTISLLGNEEFYMLIMPMLYWCMDAALGLRVGAVLLLSNATNAWFKLVFHSPRPYWISTQVTPFSAETSFGLPSGHSQNAASIWGRLAASQKERWVVPAAVVLIFLIGFSRIYLGMHFISDVLLGWVLGSLLLFAVLKLEKPLGSWLKDRSLRQMFALALASSLFLVGSIIIFSLPLSNWELPTEWVQNSLVANADDPIQPTHIEGAFTVGGTWLGLFLGAAWLYHRQGGFNASGTLGQRVLRYLIGLIGVVIFWYLLGQILPDNGDALSFGLRFLRYTLVGLWVSALAPLVFEHLGLTLAPQAKLPSFSSE